MKHRNQESSVLLIALYLFFVTHGTVSTAAQPFVRSTRKKSLRRSLQNVTQPTVSLDEIVRDVPLVFGEEGHPLCPCLRGDALPKVNLDEVNEDILDYLYTLTDDPASFGASGCGRHEIDSARCHSGVCDPRDSECEIAFCIRAYCYVDRQNCSLTNRPSGFFVRSNNRFVSYAACGQIDGVSTGNLISRLQGQNFRVGIVENTGGWMGSYSPTSSHLEGDIRDWRGPMVNFASQAAILGDYRFEVVQESDLSPKLRAEASKHFNSTSYFDYCAFLTSLGFLDFCVGQFTITNERAGSAQWITLVTEAQYLVIQVQRENLSSLGTVFRPFALSTWLFLLFVMIPLLSTLFFYHEVQHLKQANKVLRQSMVSRMQANHGVLSWKDFIIEWMESIFTFSSAILAGGFSGKVVTWGGKFTVLALNVLGLTMVACYTANLAAFFAQTDDVVNVDSFDAALRAGYRFCGERNYISEIHTIFGVPEDIFVADPDDGLPGFVDKRDRVFDFINLEKANTGDRRYCHAGVAPEQDLEALQAQRLHCDKGIVGRPVTFINTGVPVHQSISQGLTAFYLNLINNGELLTSNQLSRPTSRCPSAVKIEDAEIEPLTIEQLAGLWMLTAAFAGMGLVVTVYFRKQPHKLLSRGMLSSAHNVRQLEFNQNERTSTLREFFWRNGGNSNLPQNNIPSTDEQSKSESTGVSREAGDEVHLRSTGQGDCGDSDDLLEVENEINTVLPPATVESQDRENCKDPE